MQETNLKYDKTVIRHVCMLRNLIRNYVISWKLRKLCDYVIKELNLFEKQF